MNSNWSWVKQRTIQQYEEKMHQLAHHLELTCLLVTRGEKGMSLWHQGEFFHLDADTHQVYDVSGAGDTVIATLSTFIPVESPYNFSEMSNQQRFSQLTAAVTLANRAAGVVVSKAGTATVSLEELNESQNKPQK